MDCIINLKNEGRTEALFTLLDSKTGYKSIISKQCGIRIELEKNIHGTDKFSSNLNIHSDLVYIKVELQIEKKIDYSVNDADSFKIHMKKIRLDPYSTPYRERKTFRCNNDFNMKSYANVIKYREYLYILDVGKAFLNHSQKPDNLSVNIKDNIVYNLKLHMLKYVTIKLRSKAQLGRYL